MRLTTLALAVSVIGLSGGAAAAQDWKEYAYPDYSFTVAFPAEPKVETTTYQAANGQKVEAHVYSVAQDGEVFRVTVADLTDAAMDEGTVIGHAIKTLSAEGEVKVDIPHRVRRVYGRQLSIAGADGSHSSVALFYYKQRLYQIEGKTLPAANGGTAEAIRFQQSLVFTGDASNRSADEVRANRRTACRGAGDLASAQRPDASDNGEGRQFRCRRGNP